MLVYLLIILYIMNEFYESEPIWMRAINKIKSNAKI